MNVTASQAVRMLYGQTGMALRLPAGARVLEGTPPPALPDAHAAVLAALECPIGTPPLREMLARKKPRTAAVTVSDITRPVPNRQFLPAILQVLNQAGVADARIVILIGTGLHRPSTAEERRLIVGDEVLERVQVIDHNAQDSESLVQVCAAGELGEGEPPVSVCRRFVEADFRIVTGLIEPHFMAGFSGGRKGVCPALVDLKTVQRFHGYRTLADKNAENGVLDGNPCHAISLKVARAVGIDFLFNVAITRDRKLARIYCGDLEAAHLAGCREVGEFTTATVDEPFDLVITSGGGFPLDQTFYQTGKGMVTALPALGPDSTLLQVSECREGIGSPSYTQMVLEYGADWRRFLDDIATSADTRHDQWQVQMVARVLARIGVQRLWFGSDGLPLEVQQKIGVTPLPGQGSAQQRAQRAIDEFARRNPTARIGVIPEGPYTMLRRNQ